MQRRWITLLVLSAIGGSNTNAADKTRTDLYVSDVYLSDRDHSSEMLGPGKAVASGIFKRIGVHLNWHAGVPPAVDGSSGNGVLQTFGIRTQERAPESAAAGAIASTRIMGSSNAEITVYRDRLQCFFDDHRILAGVTGLGAGYILAHELAHAMQGIARHSESGILKAQWSNEDFQNMIFHTLAFTNFDVDLIHRGLDLQWANHDFALPSGASLAHSDLARR